MLNVLCDHDMRTGWADKRLTSVGATPAHGWSALVKHSLTVPLALAALGLGISVSSIVAGTDSSPLRALAYKYYCVELMGPASTPQPPRVCVPVPDGAPGFSQAATT